MRTKGLTNYFYKGCFISGLEEDIRAQVMMQCVSTQDLTGL